MTAIFFCNLPVVLNARFFPLAVLDVGERELSTTGVGRCWQVHVVGS